jgi:NDP-sugar pyrophosphorylase family protein
LGTIGAVGRIGPAADPLLVVNVDNISELNLRQLVERHRVGNAAMTIASHQEPFPVPFGVLEITNGVVGGYREKPTDHLWVSSGTYVLSADAVAAINPNERLDVPELFERLRARALLVTAYQHDAAWVDVNDATALVRAEQLVRRDGGLADCVHR